MTDTKRRIVIPIEQAMRLIDFDAKGKVKTFHQIGGQRIHAPWRKNDLITAMEHYSQAFGGVELSGLTASSNGYGLCIHRGDIVQQLPRAMANKMPLGWLFIKTKGHDNGWICCHCEGSGKTEGRILFQIIGDKCSSCDGLGYVPKAGESKFGQELVDASRRH